MDSMLMNTPAQVTQADVVMFLREHPEETAEAAMLGTGLVALLLSWLARFLSPILMAIAQLLQPVADWLQRFGNAMLELGDPLPHRP